jgi:hypothetical protein
MLKMKMKTIRDLILCAGFIMPLLICPRGTFGYGTGPDCMKIEIKDISYQGDSTYKVTVSLMNISEARITLREFRENFFVQAEALGQWITLTADPDDVFTHGGNPSLPPGRELTVNNVVKIYADTPSLYLNGFGEINLKFSYELNIICGEETGSFYQSGENLYWITPKSNKWTLREGM